MDDKTMFERLAHEIGDNLALCALKVIRAHVQPSDNGLLTGQLENAIAEGEAARLPLARESVPAPSEKLEGVRWRD